MQRAKPFAYRETTSATSRRHPPRRRLDRTTSRQLDGTWLGLDEFRVSSSRSDGRLVSRCLAVLAAFAGAHVNTLPVVHLHFDRLIPPVTAEIEPDFVALQK